MERAGVSMKLMDELAVSGDGREVDESRHSPLTSVPQNVQSRIGRAEASPIHDRESPSETHIHHFFTRRQTRDLAAAAPLIFFLLEVELWPRSKCPRARVQVFKFCGQ